MATTLLEREIERLNDELVEATPKTEEKSQAQILHDERIHENYQNLFRSATDTAATPVEAPASYEEPFAQTYAAPVREESYTARRLADYKAVPAAKTGLFEGMTFRNGTLYNNGAAVAVAPAAVAAPVLSVSAPAEAEEEDALPTRRTLDTLRHATVVQAEEAQQSGVGFSLSAKAKVVLAAIALFIIAAIAVICINTSILNTLNAEVTELSFSAEELRMQAQQIEQNIMDVTSEENVIEWAISQGMSR